MIERTIEVERMEHVISDETFEKIKEHASKYTKK